MVGMSILDVGGGPYTYADLEALPEGGPKHELIDGELFVSASARPLHQIVVGNLFVLLREVTPPDLRVFGNDVDIVLTNDSVLVPDLVIVRRADIGPTSIPAVPVLAVEVLSPSTRSVDLVRKKARLERAGCEHYWIIDADVPSLTCWRLVGGAYAEVAHVEGDEAVDLTAPVAVRVVPGDLLD